MRTVRIARHKKSFASQAINIGAALTDLARWLACIFAGAYIAQEMQQDRLTELKIEHMQLRARVENQRAAKISDNVVIADLKIEKLVMENKLLKAKLRAAGIDQTFEADNYSSDR